MDLANISKQILPLRYSINIALLGLFVVSSTAMASELHPIEDINLIDSGGDSIFLKAQLLMEDSCVFPTKSTLTIDHFSGVINLKQLARDPEVFCNQVITEREASFEIKTNEISPGEYELIDEFGKESLGTLYIAPNGSTDLFKYKKDLL